LVDLRNVVDAALSRTTKKAAKPPAPVATGRAKAAAAGAQFATSDSEVPEFEVTAAADWDQPSSEADHGARDDEKV
jgi:hypothetical protein